MKRYSLGRRSCFVVDDASVTSPLHSLFLFRVLTCKGSECLKDRVLDFENNITGALWFSAETSGLPSSCQLFSGCDSRKADQLWTIKRDTSGLCWTGWWFSARCRWQWTAIQNPFCVQDRWPHLSDSGSLSEEQADARHGHSPAAICEGEPTPRSEFNRTTVYFKCSRVLLIHCKSILSWLLSFAAK